MKRIRFTAVLLALVLLITSCAFAAESMEKLQRGDSGSAVREMQQALRDLGYSLTVDGKFGAGTERVVKAFQKDQGLYQDGVAGRNTLSRLWELSDDRDDALRRGSRGDAVRKLQLNLNKLGYGLTADGDFGKQTENAVRAFQLISGMQVTGVADQATQKRIQQQISGEVTVQPTEKPTQKPTDETVVYTKLQRGSSGQAVRKLQQALKTLGYAISVDGSYGPATQQVVKAFQRDQKLSADGIAGAITQQRLYKLVEQQNQATEKPTEKPTQTPTQKPSDNTQTGVAAQVTTGGGYLNLRDVTHEKVLAHIPNYAYVTVIQRDTLWCEVVYQGQCGYVMTSFLTFPNQGATAKSTATPVPEQEVGKSEARVFTQNGGGLNLREAASAGAKVLKSIPNQAIVLVRQYGKEWCAVTYQGKQGYVMTRFLTDFGADVNQNGSQATEKPTDQPTQAPVVTAQPTVKPSYDTSVFTRTLKAGYEGKDVRLMQQRLSELNYMKATDVDGSFGDSTLTAVKRFQKINGLTVDGKAGKNTFEKLFSQNAIAYSKEMEGYNDLHIYYEKADSDLVDDIQRMQTRLMQLGYTTAVTGKFDANTYLAVINFQLRNGLTVEGVADAATQSKLYSDSALGINAPPSYQLEEGAGLMQAPAVSELKLLHWTREIKPQVSSGQTMLVYDPVSRLSWNLRIYAPGRHCDSEPATLRDTLLLFRAFGKPSWDIHAVYVKLPSGQWTMATMHNYPHLTGNIKDNGFDGHVCVHFLRDMAEAKLNDPNYGVDNQNILRDAWKTLTGETVQ